MRVTHWFASICCVLAVESAGSAVLGQAPPNAPYGLRPGMGGSGAYPAAFQPTPEFATQAPYDPTYAAPHGMPPGGPAGIQGMPGAPPSMAPWPNMSPYYPQFDQLYVEDGLWQNRSENWGNSGSKRFFLKFDYLIGQSRKPTGIVGEPNALSYPETIGLDQLGQGGGQQGQQGNVVEQFEMLEEAGYPALFSRLPLGDTIGDITNQGTRMQWGFWNPDSSGVSLTLWWAFEPEEVFNSAVLGGDKGVQQQVLLEILRTPENLDDANTLIPRDVTNLQTLFPGVDVQRILQNNLLNTRGLPLNDGTLRQLDANTFSGGVTVPYDLGFKAEFSVETYGGSFDFLSTPMYKTSRLNVRPTLGARYMHVGEGFKFVGRDSGLTYSDQQAGGGGTLNPDIKLHPIPNGIDDDGDGVVDNAGQLDEGGGGGAGGQQGTFVQFRDPFGAFPITSFLENNVESHLLGPEAGFQYDLGGEKFRLSGHTKFGVMANIERVRMQGDNIAMITRDNNLRPITPENAQPNRFSDSEDHKHVSPLIEQAITMEAPLFRYVPIVRRVRFLQDANFRLGMSVIHVLEVTRPTESIVWQGNPAQNLFPRIDIDRSNYTTFHYSFGVDWQF